jgi:hypothetical protein
MSTPTKITFADHAVVACGTLSPEINYLRKTGFLDAERVLFTKPGRHEVPEELELELKKRIDIARNYADKVIVVYGDKFCYLNANKPARTMKHIIEENGPGITKIHATHCMDMLASTEERNNLSKGEKVFWLTPGWIVYRDFVFQDWDKGKANENFPKHTGGAFLLDGIGFWNRYTETHPEQILEFCDWMGIPITPQNVSLTRFKELLADCVGN